ncbi:MAG: PilT/PilU family type 4a pilus ATPase [Myxococcales bacterium]|nr:PilT/PilU family type 4a pilus ATPase [Myxococcales bacterium]
MQAPPDLIGRLAVHYKLVSMEQLSMALQAHARNPGVMLGNVMVQLGFISEPQLAQLLEAQRLYLAQQGGVQEAQPAQAAPAASRVPQPPAPSQAQRPPPPAARPPAPPPAPQPVAPSAPAGRHANQSAEWLHRVLQRSISMDARDVHVHAGAPVKIRTFDNLTDLIPDVLTGADTEAAITPSLTDEQLAILDRDGEVDFTYEIAQIGRFRVNVYREHNGLCGCFHYIPAEPPMLSDLGLPNSAAKLVNHQNGIVLITGPAGSGKTSTMAALINLLNEERTDHILSIEDPIEYVHVSKSCIVNQRQVRRDTGSFAAALRSALREDPDVICIGELRDLETISLALSAAETGHLVLGTLHTQGAIRTINRIVGAYPSSQQPQVRTMLSESLRAVISQKLIPRADRSGVALAYELLLVNLAAANLIRENRTFQLGQVLQMGRARGMRSMDDSLKELVQQRVISKAAAAREADDPRRFA